MSFGNLRVKKYDWHKWNPINVHISSSISWHSQKLIDPRKNLIDHKNSNHKRWYHKKLDLKIHCIEVQLESKKLSSITIVKFHSKVQSVKPLTHSTLLASKLTYHKHSKSHWVAPQWDGSSMSLSLHFCSSTSSLSSTSLIGLLRSSVASTCRASLAHLGTLPLDSYNGLPKHHYIPWR